jgi:hypothetical protein
VRCPISRLPRNRYEGVFLQPNRERKKQPCSLFGHRESNPELPPMSVHWKESRWCTPHNVRFLVYLGTALGVGLSEMIKRRKISPANIHNRSWGVEPPLPLPPATLDQGRPYSKPD